MRTKSLRAKVGAMGHLDRIKDFREETTMTQGKIRVIPEETKV